MTAHRPEKMANLIRSITAELIANKLNDPRISAMTSVTRVEVTGDLQFARILVSVMGTEAQQRTTIDGLTCARGLIQRELARKIHARTCPLVRFDLDQSIKRSAEIISLIDRNAAQRAADEARSSSTGHPEPQEGQPGTAHLSGE